jgi:large subunit ribosomal protein L25
MATTQLAQLAVQRFRERALIASRRALVSLPKPAPTPAGAAQKKKKPAPTPAPALALANPFLPHKVGNRWQGAAYSLRRQKALVVAARAVGPSVLALLPPGPKLPSPSAAAAAAASARAAPLAEPWAQTPITWTGAAVPEKSASAAAGTTAGRAYYGRKVAFKGHKWQRTLGKRMAHRKDLLRDMAKRITGYKNVRVLCPAARSRRLTGCLPVVLQEEEAEPAQAEFVAQGAEATVLERLIVIHVRPDGLIYALPHPFGRSYRTTPEAETSIARSDGRALLPKDENAPLVDSVSRSWRSRNG